MAIGASRVYSDCGNGIFVLYADPEKQQIEDVYMEEGNLVVTSVHSEDLADLEKLFGDPVVMKTVGIGQVKSALETAQAVARWVKKWKEEFNPFNNFTVRQKDTNRFVGLAGLMPSGEPGEAEIWGLIHRDFWNLGYAGRAMKKIYQYAQLLFVKKALVGGAPFQTIVATTLGSIEKNGPDKQNPYSAKLLEKSFGPPVGKVHKFGAERWVFRHTMQQRAKL